MIDDAVHRVAVVDVAIEVAEDEGAIYEAAGAQGGAIAMVAKWEDAGDKDGDASRQSSGRKMDAEDEVKATMATCAPGLPDPRKSRR
jgi:hypothetical protein